jgi:hypothetical protein
VERKEEMKDYFMSMAGRLEKVPSCDILILLGLVSTLVKKAVTMQNDLNDPDILSRFL